MERVPRAKMHTIFSMAPVSRFGTMHRVRLPLNLKLISRFTSRILPSFLVRLTHSHPLAFTCCSPVGMWGQPRYTRPRQLWARMRCHSYTGLPGFNLLRVRPSASPHTQHYTAANIWRYDMPCTCGSRLCNTRHGVPVDNACDSKHGNYAPGNRSHNVHH